MKNLEPSRHRSLLAKETVLGPASLKGGATVAGPASHPLPQQFPARNGIAACSHPNRPEPPPLGFRSVINVKEQHL